ncbi:MAG: hypothetical protein WAR79_02040 [Melioribacteraceae bacterium]
MVLKLLMNNPVIIGLFTMFLMWSDYLLTLVQEKERKEHYSKHYKSYPVNTIEGNPAIQESVAKLKIFNLRHFTATIVGGIGLPIALLFMPNLLHEFFLGFIWGMLLIVNAQHMTNVFGYKASRRGLHGMLFLHQRTGLIIQSSRYLATALFLSVLAVLSNSLIIYGVTIAGFVSSFRLFMLSKKVAQIEKEDLPPENISIE